MKKTLWVASFFLASALSAQTSIPVHGFLTGEGIGATADIVVSVCPYSAFDDTCLPDDNDYCEVHSAVEIDEDGFFLLFIGDGAVESPCGLSTRPFEELAYRNEYAIGIRAGAEDFGPFRLGAVASANTISGIEAGQVQRKIRDEILVSNEDDIFSIFDGLNFGTVVRLGPGIFTFPLEVVTIPAGVSMIGAGRGQTIINGSFIVSGGKTTLSDFTLRPNPEVALDIRSDFNDEVVIKNVKVESTEASVILITGDFGASNESLEIRDFDFSLVSANLNALVRMDSAQGRIIIRDGFFRRANSPTAPILEIDAASFSFGDRAKTLLVDDVQMTLRQSQALASINSNATAHLVFKSISADAPGANFNFSGDGNLVIQHSAMLDVNLRLNGNASADLLLSQFGAVTGAGGSCIGVFSAAGPLETNCTP